MEILCLVIKFLIQITSTYVLFSHSRLHGALYTKGLFYAIELPDKRDKLLLSCCLTNIATNLTL